MAHQASSLLPDPSLYPNPPRSEWVSMRKPGAESWMVGFNASRGIQLFKLYDTHDMLLRISHIVTELGKICGRGNLESLKVEIEALRATDEAPINRPFFWVWLSSDPRIWKSAYEGGHWHIIKYLVKDLGFDMTPPLRVEWALPTAIADRAVATNSTEELRRLLDLGWDINSWMGQSPYNTWTFGGLPTLSHVCTNETLVRWHISNGATPCPENMAAAAGAAPIPILKSLIECGGKVEGTNLVAHAALADLWGYPDRMEVIEYLLDIGAPIDNTARFDSPPKNPLYPLKKCIIYFQEAQTAYNIARISGNRKLEKLLLARGADAKSDIIVEEPYSRL